MHEILYQDIVKAVSALCIEANCRLPADIREALRRARETEQSSVGQSMLQDAVNNFTYAASNTLPICQDTGMAVVFCALGQEAHIAGGLLEDAVNEGVRQGYSRGYLRCSVVQDPLRRTNTNDNTPAVLHLRLTEGDQLRITVAPKGFGSENMTALRMFNPSVTQREIEDFIVQTVDRAGSNPCPPVIESDWGELPNMRRCWRNGRC